MSKHIHIHVGAGSSNRKVKDVSGEQEAAYQAIMRAKKFAQQVVDSLSSAAERAKTGKGGMTPDLARKVEDLMRTAKNSVV